MSKPKRGPAARGPHPCAGEGCDTILTDRKRYCETCRVARIRDRAQSRNKSGPRPTYQARVRPPRWFSGRTVTVVHDPDPYPLSPGLTLDRHCTMTMVAEGCFTPGTRLRDSRDHCIYIVGATP